MALYQRQLAGHDREELLGQFTELPEYARADAAYFEALLSRVLAEADLLDELIAKQASRGLNQLDAVDRAVLWLALAELKYRPDVPTKVIINEAVELAKRYGPVDGFRFVNAVLDRVAREIRPAAEGQTAS
jgi:transcription antitermination protein NusB